MERQTFRRLGLHQWLISYFTRQNIKQVKNNGLLSGSLSLLVYGQDTSNTTIHDGFSVFLSDFERFNDLACLMLWNVVM